MSSASLISWMPGTAPASCMRNIWASVRRAVSPGATRTVGSSSRPVPMVVSSISCSPGSYSMCGLGVMAGVMARLKLSQASYCEFESPSPASSCGWVASTW